MKLISYLRFLALVVSVGGGIILSSCTPESSEWDNGFTLHYPSITNTAPGKYFSLTPSWFGGTPSDFQIVSVKLNGEAVLSECFVVDASTGEFKLLNSGNLSVGKYEVTISCVVAGVLTTFPNIISVEMMKPVPEEILMQPEMLTTNLESIMSSDGAELPTSKVTTQEGSHVTITSYSIANVYVDGTLANDCLDWFHISEDGVFSIVKDNEDFEPGVYTFDFRLTTYFVNEISEEGLFVDALTLKVTSAPYRLEYSPSTTRIEEGTSSASPQPSYKGSLEGLRFEVASVVSGEESISDSGIVIDPQTGVLSFPADAGAKAGESYTVSVKAINDFGEKVFPEAFCFEIIEYIAPITQFSYPDVSRKLAGAPIEVAPAVMDGTEVSYSFVNLPEELAGLKLDADGTIRNVEGNEFPHGTYQVTVRAKNAKGDKDAVVELDIANFTYVCWGNNLGDGGAALTPERKYGNQFRLSYDSAPISIALDQAEHDIPQGYDVAFSATTPNIIQGGINVNAEGTLTITPQKTDTRLLFSRVEVKVCDENYTLIRHIPVFVDKYNSENCRVMFTPFAIRVNPELGGMPEVEVTDVAGNKLGSDFYMDIHKETAWFNIDGPETHQYDNYYKNDGMKTSFLRHVWARYYSAINKKVPTSMNNNPVSYWKNQETLALTAAYVDPTSSFKIKVNPGMFMDDMGVYADGAMFLQMTFEESESSKVPRAFLWLDSDYDAADYQTE